MQRRDNPDLNELFLNPEDNSLISTLGFNQLNYFTENNLNKGFAFKSQYYEPYLLDFIRHKRGEFILDVELIFKQLVTYAKFMVSQGLNNFGIVSRKSDKEIPILRAFCDSFGISFIHSSPGSLTNKGVTLPRFLIFYNPCSLFGELQDYSQYVLTLFYTPDRPPQGADYFLIKGNYSLSTVRTYFEILAWLINYFKRQ